MSSPLRELTPEQFSRISQLLDESLELAPDERHGWLTALEQRDPEAAALLRRLLAPQEDGEAARFLNQPAPMAAALASALSADRALVDRRFGPYRILSLLGHGGMGSVWLAERVDGLFTRQVALKLVHPILGPQLTERFSREREILASLSHPHIARLFDAEERQIGGRQWAAIDRHVRLAGARIRADRAAVGIVDHGDRELRLHGRCRGKLQRDADQSALQQQAVTLGAIGRCARAVRAIDRREQYIAPAAEEVSHLHTRRAEPEGLAGHVTGRAAAPIGSETLEEGAGGGDRAVVTVILDRAGWVRKELGIGGASGAAGCRRRLQMHQRRKGQDAGRGD